MMEGELTENDSEGSGSRRVVESQDDRETRSVMEGELRIPQHQGTYHVGKPTIFAK